MSKDSYFPLKYVIKGLPKILGCPQIVESKLVPYSKFRIRDPDTGQLWKFPDYMETPENCSIQKMVDWDWDEFGALLFALLGNQGQGKSNLKSGFDYLYLAKNTRLFTFNDRNFEAKHIAKGGFYDSQDNFHSYNVNVWIPEGYQFNEHNNRFLWKARQNVHLCEYTDIKQILESSIENDYTIQVIYDECFDELEQVLLWTDLIKTMSLYTFNANYMFTHHELADLFPESPSGDLWHAIRKAAKEVKRLRKYDIGLSSCYHQPSEVFQTITAKHGYIINKQPTYRKSLTPSEQAAVNYNIQQSNFTLGGYWRKHTIGKFAEINRKRYRIYPGSDLYNYPDLTIKHDELETTENEFSALMTDPINAMIWTYYQQGKSFRTIQDQPEIPIRQSAIRDRIKKLETAYGEFT